MNIKEILSKGESQTVEFKKNFDKECIETTVAFANTKGGTIFIGVNDEGKAKGIDLGNLVEMKILKMEGVGKRDIHYVLIEPKMSRRRAE